MTDLRPLSAGEHRSQAESHLDLAAALIVTAVEQSRQRRELSVVDYDNAGVSDPGEIADLYRQAQLALTQAQVHATLAGVPGPESSEGGGVLTN